MAELPPKFAGLTTWGRVALWATWPLAPRLFAFPPTPVDIILGDEGLSLCEYGLSGEVVSTPGHSAGSVSVLLDTGDAFVGCLAHSGLPFRLRPGLPIFGEDVHKLRESWDLVLSQGAETMYPAHGRPFSADEIREALS